MALWQFTLDLIPASAAHVGGVDAIRLSREQLDAIRLNLSEAQAANLFIQLEEMLPEKQSWSPRLRIWGDEKSDDVQVHFEGSAIEDVQFRLDVSNLSLVLVSQICAAARRLDCVLATREGAIVQPSTEAIVRSVLQSAAMRFVKDPEAYLREAVLIDGQTD